MGKKLKYTVEEVRKIVDDYFTENKREHWTITGLAIIFGSKQLLSDYGERDGYKEIIQLARLRVEEKYERYLLKPGTATGAIFALKNFGWKDRTEIEHDIGDVNINPIKWVK